MSSGVLQPQIIERLAASSGLRNLVEVLGAKIVQKSLRTPEDGADVADFPIWPGYCIHALCKVHPVSRLCNVDFRGSRGHGLLACILLSENLAGLRFSKKAAAKFVSRQQLC